MLGSLVEDDFSTIRFGDWVQSLVNQYDDMSDSGLSPRRIARPGSTGEVIETIWGRPPFIYWHRSESYGCALPYELEVLCRLGDFCDEATTPKSPAKVYIRRGKQ